MTVRRVAAVIRLRPEAEVEYRRLHDAVWPEVIEVLRRSNVTNYSIFLRDDLLFSYFEYVGHDFERDTAAIAVDATVQKWWALTDPCQEPLDSAATYERWVTAEELCHIQ